MPKNIQKTIQNYISKIKKQAPHLQISHSSISNTTSKLLSGCKHPKSLSYDFEHREHQQHKNDEAATLEDIDRFLIENFKSLYGQELGHNDNDDDEEKDKQKERYTRNGSESSGVLYDSPRFFTPPVDLNNGSYRFLASQASSGSLLEETRLSGSVGTSTSDEVRSVLSPSLVDTMVQDRDQVKNDKPAIPEGIDDCIAVLTVSPSPYEDFRKSMLGVLEGRIHHNQRVDWDFMQELLFCYLRLNEKKQYRFILSAFVDLVVVLRQNSSNGRPEGSKSSDGDDSDVKGKKRGGY